MSFYIGNIIGAAKDDCGSFEIGVGVDPRKELNAILKNGGGLNLGYRLMKESLHIHVRILWVAQKACWDWYTSEIKNTKSPAHALAYSWRMCNWAEEPHLWATLSNTLFEPRWLNFMEIPLGRSQDAARALAISWSTVTRRAWTLSKHSSPPECYAEVLRPGDAFEAARQTATASMKRHHENVLALERSVHILPDAQKLWDECLWLDMQPVRVLFEYFRRDQYRPTSECGLHLLMGLEATMADNKAVEDIHAPLRIAAKKGSNDKLSSIRTQDIINNSNVLEARGVKHAAAVTKDLLLQPHAYNFRFLQCEHAPCRNLLCCMQPICIQCLPLLKTSNLHKAHAR